MNFGKNANTTTQDKYKKIEAFKKSLSGLDGLDNYYSDELSDSKTVKDENEIKDEESQKSGDD